MVNSFLYLLAELRKSKLPFGVLGIDLSTVNLQTEFQKLILPYGDLGMDSIKVNLQTEF